MSYGFAIRQPNGRLWCSPDVTPMVFHQKITLVSGTHFEFTTSVPISQPIMIFYKPRWGGERGALIFKKGSRNGCHLFGIKDWSNRYESGNNYFSIGFDIYVFTTAYNRMPSNYGLNVFNSNGKLVYSADLIPLQLKWVSRASIPSSGYNFGANVAVSPCASWHRLYIERSPLGQLSYTEERYVASTNGAGVYTESILYSLSWADPFFNYSFMIKNIFYIETEIYDRYINMTK